MPSPRNPLLKIPGVGPKMADLLLELGVAGVEDLRGRDSQKLFETACALRGRELDPCVLYVFRCAIEFAATGEKGLRWWDFKDV